MFTQQSIIQLFKDHWHQVKESDVKAICAEGGGISAFECVLMYLYILSTRPRSIIEFSPNHGYSSMAIAMAQRQMRNRWAFATFEINKTFCARTNARIAGHRLTEYCQCVQGNANTEVPKYVKRKGCYVDFCFIDSDHRAQFAQNYIKLVFPSLQPGCLIGVHDIAANKRSSNGSGTFKSSLQEGTYKDGEEQPIRQYLNNNKLPYTVLHGITGGNHEGARQEVNNELYDEIQKISGIDFRKAKGACPKTLFFRL